MGRKRTAVSVAILAFVLTGQGVAQERELAEKPIVAPAIARAQAVPKYAKVYSARVGLNPAATLADLEALARKTGSVELLTLPASGDPCEPVKRELIRFGDPGAGYPGFAVRSTAFLAAQRAAGGAAAVAGTTMTRATVAVAGTPVDFTWAPPVQAGGPASVELAAAGAVIARNVFHPVAGAADPFTRPRVIHVVGMDQGSDIVQVFEYFDKRPEIKLEPPASFLPLGPNAFDEALFYSDPLTGDASLAVLTDSVNFGNPTRGWTGFHFDTGWLPGGSLCASALQGRVFVNAAASISAHVEGDFRLDTSARALRPGSGSGTVWIDLGFDAGGQGSLCVNLPWPLPDIDWQFTLAGIDARVNDKTKCFSFLLNSCCQASDSQSVPALCALPPIPIPGLSGNACITLGGSATFGMCGDSISVSDGNSFTSEGQSRGVTISCSGYHRTANYNESGTVTAGIVVGLSIGFDITIWSWSYDPSFDFPVLSLNAPNLNFSSSGLDFNVDSCGNGVCDCGETCNSCPSDCDPTCGDGTCSTSCGETSGNCCQDCAQCCNASDCGPCEICQGGTCVSACGPCESCQGGVCVGNCGNGSCEPACNEDCSTCSSDCSPSCGDGICDASCGETSATCCIDCGCGPCDQCVAGVCVGNCGNGSCEPTCNEDCSTCPSDCSPTCGDGICDASCGETSATCCVDCGCGPCDQCVAGVCVGNCGNGSCEPTCNEDCSTCPSDCSPTCGDGTCDASCGETTATCCVDCGCGSCGQCVAGVCVGNCGNGSCELACNEDCSTCPSDCPPICGDGTCDASCGETTANCPGDCGACCLPTVSTCPGEGDCCLDNGSPGCSDAGCCNSVCLVDPFCCDTQWDLTCLGEAAELCGCVGPACCDPWLASPHCVQLAESTCRNLGGAVLGPNTVCPADDDCHLCGAFPAVCEYCWVGTTFENNCPIAWCGDGTCDCGCQFVDEDCAGGGSCPASPCTDPVCDFCWIGTPNENNCPVDWIGTADGCDCGCQVVDPDCAGPAARNAITPSKLKDRAMIFGRPASAVSRAVSSVCIETTAADCAAQGGDFQGGGVVCDASVCSCTTDADCDDGNLCTVDSCDPATGNCLNTPVDCDDGDPCTDDTCSNGSCQNLPNFSCGDGVCNNACGETMSNCCSDCASCGDGMCSSCEDAITCSQDCDMCSNEPYMIIGSVILDCTHLLNGVADVPVQVVCDTGYTCVTTTSGTEGIWSCSGVACDTCTVTVPGTCRANTCPVSPPCVDSAVITVDDAHIAENQNLVFSECANLDLDCWSHLATCMTGPHVQSPTGCDVFDADSDNDVDLRDAAAFQGAFTGP